MAEIVAPARPGESIPPAGGRGWAVITGPSSPGRPAPRQHPGQAGDRAPGAPLTAPACLRPPRCPGHVAELAHHAPPLRLRHHLALPFTDVLAADVGVHGHVPTLGSPVTGESSGPQNTSCANGPERGNPAPGARAN